VASAASSTSTASEPAGGAGVGAKRSRKQQLQTVPEAAAEAEPAGPSKRQRKGGQFAQDRKLLRCSSCSGGEIRCQLAI
jgi:hypothetical protein